MAGKDASIKSVRISGGSYRRITATELVGGVICRVTLEQDTDGSYREVSWTPIPVKPDTVVPAR